MRQASAPTTVVATRAGSVEGGRCVSTGGSRHSAGTVEAPPFVFTIAGKVRASSAAAHACVCTVASRVSVSVLKYAFMLGGVAIVLSAGDRRCVHTAARSNTARNAVVPEYVDTTVAERTVKTVVAHASARISAAAMAAISAAFQRPTRVRKRKMHVIIVAVEFVLSPTEGGLPPCVRNSARLRLEGPPRSLAIDM